MNFPDVHSVLVFFDANISELDRERTIIKAELNAHRHTIFCVPWVWCRRCERRLRAVETDIRAFEDAAYSIRRGTYRDALTVLQHVAFRLMRDTQCNRWGYWVSEYDGRSIPKSPTQMLLALQKMHDHLAHAYHETCEGL